MKDSLLQEILEDGGTTLLVIRADDLKKAILDTVNETKRQLEDEVAKNNSETLLTGQQVQERLNISRTTLWNWRKDGYLLPIEIGGKIRYKLSDVNTILQTNSSKKKQ